MGCGMRRYAVRPSRVRADCGRVSRPTACVRGRWVRARASAGCTSRTIVRPVRWRAHPIRISSCRRSRCWNLRSRWCPNILRQHDLYRPHGCVPHPIPCPRAVSHPNRVACRLRTPSRSGRGFRSPRPRSRRRADDMCGWRQTRPRALPASGRAECPSTGLRRMRCPSNRSPGS